MAAISCPGCGFRANLPAGAAGKAVRCPRCQMRFEVPAAAPVPSAGGPASGGPTGPLDHLVAPVAPPLPLPTEPEGVPAPPTLPEPGALPARGAGSRRAPTLPAAPRPALAEWQVGDVVLDLYEVTGILGQGGMGRVYRVRHRGWGVDLAVKAPLPSALQAVGGADNFEREAETWVNLGLHPHVAACYYVRRVDGIPRVFAELVDGGSLHDWIQKRRLVRLEQVLDLAIQFAWGLHYAHEQGLVHQDVKPANVLVTPDGVAKVTDFGLARARPAGAGGGQVVSGQTMMVAGSGAGTLAYMAPEQATGEPLTRRTDLWAWALSVLEMFRGERTWESGIAAPEVLADFLAQGGKSLGLPAMPHAVAELLGRCFRKNPDERPRSLWDAAAALYAAYEAAASSPYHRQEPQAGRDTADSLNNRAVSLLDLGREGEAEALWQRALSSQAHHLEATYNEALHDWSRGRASDEEMLNRMAEALKTHESAPRAHHLLGKLLLSAGEYVRAVRSLEEATRFGPGSPELDRDLGLALCAQARDAADAALWARAAACLESAMSGGRDPGDIAGYALCLRRQGREREALRFYADEAERRRDLPPSLDQAVSLHLPGHEARRLLKGLGRPASSLALTHDGRLVLAGDGVAVRQWDAETAIVVRTLQADEGGVRSLAVTPDGQSLVWAGENVPPQLRDIDSGRPGRAFQRHPGFLAALAITPDGARLVSGGSDRTVRVWDMASGRCLHALEGHAEAVVAVAVSADGARAVSGSLDGTVRLWDLLAGAALLQLEGHKERVSAVALLDSQGLAVSGGGEVEDYSLRLWELATGRLVASLAGHTDAVTSLAVAADESFVVSGSRDRTVRAWDVERRRLLFLARLEAPVRAVALGPGGLVWAASGTTVTALALPDRPRLALHVVSRPVSADEAVSREATFLERVEGAQESLRKGNLKQALDLAREARAVRGYERSEAGLTLWDELGAVLPRKGLRSAWEVASLEGHSDPLLAVAVSPDGGRALSGGMDATVRLWDLGSRQMLSVLKEHQDTVAAVAFCPDGRRAVSGSWDRTARVWDLVSGRCLLRLEGHADYVSGVAVAPDGARLLTASWDQTLRLWDLASGSCVGVLEGHTSNVSTVAFGPDGRFAVSGGWEGVVRAWDIETRACVCVLEGHESNVSALGLSPSGRQVSSGGLDGSVRVWDLKSRRAVRTLTGHTAEVTAIAFTPDGRYVVSAGRDKAVKVWDVGTGRCERTLDLTAPALELGLTPVGNELVTAQADRTVRIWHLDWEPEDPEARALPAWDEKVRPYLETFVSLRLKPQTLRPTAPAFTNADVDHLLDDLRHRGFGGLRRESLVSKLRALTVEGQAPPSFWDEVRRTAPRRPRASTEPPLWRRLPLKKIALAAVLLALFVVGVLSWFRPPAQPVIMEHWVKVVQDQQRLIDVKSFTGACDEGGLDHYLQKAGEREVSAETLACVLRYANQGTADAYLDGVTLTDPDALNLQRRLRNAISLLVALGEPAVDPLCRRLGDPREEVRRVAARALVAMGSATSSTCLVKGLTDPSPAVRGSAAYVLDRMLMGGQMSADGGWAALTALLQDPAPSVRALALGALPLYATGVAEPAAQRALQDPDPDVRAAADRALVSIKTAHKLRQLSGRE